VTLQEAAQWPHRSGKRQRAMADTPQGCLFEDDPGMQATAAPVKAPVNGIARVHMPTGVQLEMRVSDLDALLSEDHRARVVLGVGRAGGLEPDVCGHPRGGRRGQRALVADRRPVGTAYLTRCWARCSAYLI
jgi:hypothetical protein